MLKICIFLKFIKSLIINFMFYTYRFRIYPNKEQEAQIKANFDCNRFVYNYFLDLRIKYYETDHSLLSASECSKKLTVLKKEKPWLYDADATSLQYTLKNLDNAFRRFFSARKNGASFGFPKFKKKKSNKNSYTVHGSRFGIIVTFDDIKLPKLGKVKCKTSKHAIGRVISCTITQNPSGKYYVSVYCEKVDFNDLPKTGEKVGIDLGVKDFITTSDGEKYENIKFTKQASKKIAKLQRDLARKKKGSKRYEKQRIKYAREMEHIQNQRKDRVHKITTDLIRRYDVICIEDLQSKKLMKNKFVSRNMQDTSFYELRRELEYKADWYGKQIVVIDKFYPSSQICSNCGYRNESVKNLNVRKWICPNCGVEHDRDINAAKNILYTGLKKAA